MSDSLNQTQLEWYCYAVAYSPFFTILMGLTGNPLTLIILRTDKELKLQSSMMFFSFISILNIFALFTWNLNTYFKILYHFEYSNNYLITCKLMTFLQFLSRQSSALLTGFIPIDRYFTIVSRPGSRLPFGTLRTAFVWSSVITTLIFILNFHILILNGHSTSTFENKTLIDSQNQRRFELNEKNNFVCNIYSNSFDLYKYWNIVDLIVYCLIPSLVMVVFNGLIIVQTLKLGQTAGSADQRSLEMNKKKRQLTVSLLAITFLFVCMSSMVTIFFLVDGFIPQSLCFERFFSIFEFLFHSTLFLDLYITNIYFRNAVHKFFKRIKE